MDMKALADLKSPLYQDGVQALHSQKWQLSQNLKIYFHSAEEVIHKKGETLILTLHSKGNQNTKQNGHEFVYNGLKNQGATCYLNSVLQVLFMTTEFREAVERSQGTQKDNDLLYQLQQLFKDLQGDHKCASTVNITRSLCIGNVYEQQDAVEWFEKILNAVTQDVSQVYEGRLQKTLRCLKKDHEESHEGSKFFSLPLAIDARHDEVFNVVDGLEAFFKTTRFDEDDWLYCDDCDEKTDTEISFKLEKHPTILTLHLKRFYFDYMNMRYQKNSCPIDIPLTLDEFKNLEYDLYGVISHFGVYGGGHYCAYVKSPENNNWYCFDDSNVSEVTVKDFLNGSRTAYVIVYRKRESSPSQQEEEHIKSSTTKSFKTATADELRPNLAEDIHSNTVSESHGCQNIVLTQESAHSIHSPIKRKTRVSKHKNCKKKSKDEKNGKVTKTVSHKNSNAARLTKTVPHKLLQNSIKVPFITPGTVLVLRTGRHQGKRVVFLKHLPSGLLLLTGPFALNRVPLSRVSPNSVTATAMKVGISGLKIPDTVTDTFLRRRRRRRRQTEPENKEEEDFEMEMERPRLAEQRRREQRVVDSQVLPCVRKVPRVRRSLSSRPQCDLLKNWIGWIILLLVILMLHLHAVNTDLLVDKSMI